MTGGVDLGAGQVWREKVTRWAPPPPETPPPGAETGDGWRAFAPRFRAINQEVRGREEPFVRFLAPWLGPDVSVLEIGAGGGRFTLPLAERVGRLTAVEPSAGMREVLLEAVAERGLDVDVAPQGWPGAAETVGSADLVVCANVLYDVQELGPFLLAADQAARRGAFMFLTLSHPVGYISELWREFRGWETPTGPTYLDAAAVAYEVGIPTNITLVPVEATLVFSDWDDMLGMYRRRLGLEPDPVRDERLRAALGATVKEVGGQLVVPPREARAAVIWWEKG